ncbi:HNH endonuclease [Microvirga calopogonii]|uniref:HNH endonuclease n=1 Tax=Microvirga calopogonii TaxID=2078013 RepID=UPI0013B4332C|nr:HNH endonuclease [Microvirga calopogonii]
MAVRKVRVEGDVAVVPLTRGMEAVVDIADLPLVEGFNWRAFRSKSTWYAVRHDRLSDGRPTLTHMHRTIFRAEPGKMVDHRDGDGLNNRRGNLRSAIHAQNARNAGTRKDSTSGIKSVTWHAKRQK